MPLKRSTFGEWEVVQSEPYTEVQHQETGETLRLTENAGIENLGSLSVDKSFSEAGRVGQVAKVTENGGYTPFNGAQREVSEYHDGTNRTYLAYRGDDANPFFTWYDHVEAIWGPQIKVATNPLENSDQHGQPTFAINDSGAIVLGYGSHDSDLRVATSHVDTPKSWTDEGAVTDIPQGTYPHLRSIGDTFYQFYRTGGVGDHGDTYPNHEFGTIAESTDGGVSWSDLGPVIDTSGHPDADSDAYVMDFQVRNGHLHFTWTVAHGPSHDGIRTGFYHAYYDPTTASVYDLAGTSYGSTITWSDHNSGVLRGDDRDHIVVPKAYVSDDESEVYGLYARKTDTTVKWTLASYSGGSWSTQEVADARTDNATSQGAVYTDGEEVVCHVTESVGDATLTRSKRGRGGSWMRYVLDDGSWSSERLISQDDDRRFKVGGVARVRNRHDDLSAIAFEGDRTRASDQSGFADATGDHFGFRLWAYGGAKNNTEESYRGSLNNTIYRRSPLTTQKGSHVLNSWTEWSSVNDVTGWIYESAGSEFYHRFSNNFGFSRVGWVWPFHAAIYIEDTGDLHNAGGQGFTTEPDDLRGTTGARAGEIRNHDGSGSAGGTSAGPKTWRADGSTDAWFDGSGNSFT